MAAYQMAAEVMDRVGIGKRNFSAPIGKGRTKNYQVDLETLQYDILYGKQYVYDGENPFERTEMHLGVKDAVLDKIEKISDGRYYITGENFTQSAYVEVNGELLETTYISPTTLLLNDVELKDGDEVDVATEATVPPARCLPEPTVLSTKCLWSR